MTRFTKFFIILFCLSYPCFSVSHGQGIVLDPSSVGTSFLRASDGSNPFDSIDVINIATPESGVSLNRYNRFDVGIEDGVYLNNLTSDGVSRAGLDVTANPHLVSGPASMIVNEVTGDYSSSLRGFVEVVGSSADIVIANQNGVNCDGCSFVNSPHVSLSSGSVSFDSPSGSLDINVGRRGAVTIGESGLSGIGHEGVYLSGRQVLVDGSISLDAPSGVRDRVNILASIDRISMTSPDPDDSDDSANSDYSKFGRWRPSGGGYASYGTYPRKNSIEVSSNSRIMSDVIIIESGNYTWDVDISGALVSSNGRLGSRYGSAFDEIASSSSGSVSSFTVPLFNDLSPTDDASFTVPDDWFLFSDGSSSDGSSSAASSSSGSSADGSSSSVSSVNLVSIKTQSDLTLSSTSFISTDDVKIRAQGNYLSADGMILSRGDVDMASNGFTLSRSGVMDADGYLGIVSFDDDMSVLGAYRSSDATTLANFGGHLEIGPSSRVSSTSGRVALYGEDGIDVRGEVSAHGNVYVFSGSGPDGLFNSSYLTVHPEAIVESTAGFVDLHTDGLIEVHRGGSISTHSDDRLTLRSHKPGDIVISGEVNGYGLVELINDSGSLDVRTGSLVRSERGIIKGYGSAGILVSGIIMSHDDIEFSHLVHRNIWGNPVSTGLSPSLVLNSGGSLTSRHGDISVDVSGSILVSLDSAIVSNESIVTLHSTDVGDISISGYLSGLDYALVTNDDGSIIIAGDVEVSSSGSVRIDGSSHRASVSSPSSSAY